MLPSLIAIDELCRPKQSPDFDTNRCFHLLCWAVEVTVLFLTTRPQPLQLLLPLSLNLAGLGIRVASKPQYWITPPVRNSRNLDNDRGERERRRKERRRDFSGFVSIKDTNQVVIWC